MKRKARGSKGLHFRSLSPAQHYVGKSHYFRPIRRARVRPLVLLGFTILALFLTGPPAWFATPGPLVGGNQEN